MDKILIGGFEYSQDEKSNWIFKAAESNPISSAKPKYKELPQFPLNSIIEDKAKNNFRKIVNHTVLEITQYLKDNL